MLTHRHTGRTEKIEVFTGQVGGGGAGEPPPKSKLPLAEGRARPWTQARAVLRAMLVGRSGREGGSGLQLRSQQAAPSMGYRPQRLRVCTSNKTHTHTQPQQKTPTTSHMWHKNKNKNKNAHLAVEQPRRTRCPGNRRHLGRRRHGRQRRAPGEVAAAADADAGQAGVEVVAVEVQEPQQQRPRVHLAGLFLEVPVVC